LARRLKYFQNSIVTETLTLSFPTISAAPSRPAYYAAEICSEGRRYSLWCSVYLVIFTARVKQTRQAKKKPCFAPARRAENSNKIKHSNDILIVFNTIITVSAIFLLRQEGNHIKISEERMKPAIPKIAAEARLIELEFS
jgi:hypothetical protein